VGDFSTIFAVVHHQQVELLNVAHNILQEAVWKKVASALVGSKPNLRGNLSVIAPEDRHKRSTVELHLGLR
jgi:hypothetical protein